MKIYQTHSTIFMLARKLEGLSFLLMHQYFTGIRKNNNLLLLGSCSNTQKKDNKTRVVFSHTAVD